nr:MAG TPA: hypothetical protein [Caudoviricetes sp.]
MQSQWSSEERCSEGLERKYLRYCIPIISTYQSHLKKKCYFRGKMKS